MNMLARQQAQRIVRLTAHLALISSAYAATGCSSALHDPFLLRRPTSSEVEGWRQTCPHTLDDSTVDRITRNTSGGESPDARTWAQYSRECPDLITAVTTAADEALRAFNETHPGVNIFDPSPDTESNTTSLRADILTRFRASEAYACRRSFLDGFSCSVERLAVSPFWTSSLVRHVHEEASDSDDSSQSGSMPGLLDEETCHSVHLEGNQRELELHRVRRYALAPGMLRSVLHIIHGSPVEFVGHGNRWVAAVPPENLLWYLEDGLLDAWRNHIWGSWGSMRGRGFFDDEHNRSSCQRLDTNIPFEAAAQLSCDTALSPSRSDSMATDWRWLGSQERVAVSYSGSEYAGLGSLGVLGETWHRSPFRQTIESAALQSFPSMGCYLASASAFVARFVDAGQRVSLARTATIEQTGAALTGPNSDCGRIPPRVLAAPEELTNGELTAARQFGRTCSGQMAAASGALRNLPYGTLASEQFHRVAVSAALAYTYADAELRERHAEAAAQAEEERYARDRAAAAASARAGAQREADAQQEQAECMATCTRRADAATCQRVCANAR